MKIYAESVRAEAVDARWYCWIDLRWRGGREFSFDTELGLELSWEVGKGEKTTAIYKGIGASGRPEGVQPVSTGQWDPIRMPQVKPY